MRGAGENVSAQFIAFSLTICLMRRVLCTWHQRPPFNIHLTALRSLVLVLQVAKDAPQILVTFAAERIIILDALLLHVDDSNGPMQFVNIDWAHNILQRENVFSRGVVGPAFDVLIEVLASLGCIGALLIEQLLHEE